MAASNASAHRSLIRSSNRRERMRTNYYGCHKSRIQDILYFVVRSTVGGLICVAVNIAPQSDRQQPEGGTTPLFEKRDRLPPYPLFSPESRYCQLPIWQNLCKSKQDWFQLLQNLDLTHYGIFLVRSNRQLARHSETVLHESAP